MAFRSRGNGRGRPAYLPALHRNLGIPPNLRISGSYRFNQAPGIIFP
jgi:hypothetical protein